VSKEPESALFSLAGKVALLTGATRGIGLATAQMLARQGAAVVISSRKADACAAVVEDFKKAGHEALGVAAHAARPDDLKHLMEKALERFGRIDILVCNAGINPSFDPLTDLPEDSWARIMDTNVSGPLRLARLVLPHMAATGGGAMVAVSSVNARVALAGSGAYGVSKAALEQMTRQLAVEWGARGVRVNAVAPGTIRTDMIRALLNKPGYIDTIKHNTPVGRLGEPADVAAAIVFLASDEARHISGQILTSDGGQTITRASAAKTPDS
jgi:dehydrogenase/reductase SDR family protein 4